MALGPIVGGLLIEGVGWRSVFWINLPICAAAVILTAVFVPESKSATMRSIDPIGQVLAVAALFGLVFVLIEGPGLGWSDPRTIAVAVAAAVAFVAFLRYESHRHDPFIDLRFFGAFAVYGIGFGMVNAPVTNAAVSGMPQDRAGAASAVTSTSRQVGVSIGVALCGSLAGTALAGSAAQFADAARPLWWVSIGLGLCIVVLSIVSTSERAHRSAQRLAPLIGG